ncbi:MAG TPA: EAL domain-containing protein [Castellaniella sp.]|nr:EAL domain-containing protein [Castellaniella sp.]
MLIHPSYQADFRRALRAVSMLLVLLVLVGTLSVPPAFHHVAHYLSLHVVVEMLSVVTAALIFAVIWSSRREALPRTLVLLGSTFMGVALLDFLHLLSYPGMPPFITPNDAEKAIYFWLLARLVGALGLLAAGWIPWHDRHAWAPFHVQVPAVLLLVAGACIVYFEAPSWLPRTFLPGVGLTSFKISAEYVLIALYLAAAVLFLRRMRLPKHFNAGDLFVAACVMAQSEFFLTLYSRVNDGYILFGHLYKVVAYIFLYRAVFTEAVQHPYALLQESREQLRATLDALPDLVFDMDVHGRYLGVHTSHPEDLSLPAERLLGMSVHDAMSPRDSRIVVEALLEASRQGQSRGKVITLHLNGEDRHFELSVARKSVPAGHAPEFAVISRDITDRVKSEQALRTLSTAVVQSPESIIITDRHARIEFVNDAFTRVSGYAAREVLGRNLRRLKPGRTPATTYRAMWAQLAQGRAWRGEWVNLSKSGREYIESVLIYPVRNAQGEVTNYLAHNEDVTENRRSAERIRSLSHYDQLTGLPNRLLLRDQCQAAIDQGGPLAVLWIDLDHFKAVNDSLGHHVGDALLQEVAQRIRKQLPEAASLARYSGDDFVAVLPGAGRQAAGAQADGLLQTIYRSLRLAEQDIYTSASIGVALYPQDATDFDVLLKHAETAMYRAKSEGRHCVGFFTREMQAHVSRELVLVNGLKQAIQNGELFLVYQPQVSFRDGRILGAEALLRWESPQWGRVPPSEFIPIAEASGLIVAIGDWVLRTAMQQLRRWRDEGMQELRIAVNLSAVQFNRPDLLERIRAILEEAGVPAQWLELELTEAVAMKAPEAAAQRMEELSRFGVQFAIDDFGTGYSSLSYLKRFRLHKLKIDQSFVRDINRDPDDQAIAAAIIQLSRSLGLRTIAEGVETLEQQEFLRANGCEEAQGYYYSRPLQAEAFAAYVRQRGAAAGG